LKKYLCPVKTEGKIIAKRKTMNSDVDLSAPAWDGEAYCGHKDPDNVDGTSGLKSISRTLSSMVFINALVKK